MSFSDLSVHGASASPAAAKASAPEPCPHGLRPGTTVCLHCLREKRLAARNRIYRTVARVALGFIAAVLVTALGVGAVSSLKPSLRSATTTVKSAAVKTIQAGKAAVTRSPLGPSVDVGRTDLAEGIFVERSATGDSVVVHFDTETMRTRFDWKFEGVVRATLPTIYPRSRVVLDSIPQATLVRGDLVRDLTRRGIRIDLGADGTLTVWPLTRQGQDGPLVVAYRVTASH